MAFTELELKRIDTIVGGLCERRSRPESCDQLRIEYSVSRHDVEIFEVRPRWDNPDEEMQTPVAKARFVRTANEWLLYRMRHDRKWHLYELFPSSRDLKDIVDEIDRDEICCFFI
ncbi:MAG: DUF3024 domain-containing protein [Acidobacteriota bacterium]